MKNIKNMKIKGKILGGFAVIIMFLMIVGGFSINTLNKTINDQKY